MQKSGNKIIFIVIIAFFLLNCKKEKRNECNVNDPLTELSWMKELKKQVDDNCNSCEVFIIQAIYDDRTVYYTSVTDPLCNSIFGVALLNCDGQLIKNYNDANKDDFYSQVSDRKKLYSCKARN